MLGSLSGSYHCQGPVNKYVIGWKKLDRSPTLEESEMADCGRLVTQLKGIPLSNGYICSSAITFYRKYYLKLWWLSSCCNVIPFFELILLIIIIFF